MKKSSACALLLVMLVPALALSACAGIHVAYVDQSAVYSKSDLQALLETTTAEGVSTEPAERAPDLRHDSLVELRSQGRAQSAFADLITRSFPTASEGVPVYVEQAVVDGQPAVVVVEAWGKVGARIDRKRLWVLERSSGDILFSAVLRE